LEDLIIKSSDEYLKQGVKMNKKFVKGRWYKYIGNKSDYGLLWSIEMDLVLDKKWNKCVFGSKNYAQFEKMKNYCYWDREDFEESKNNPDKENLR
jgi:hypothetical protein